MSSTESADPALLQLRASVFQAAEFLRVADENLADGYQTARQVLSHLVFWHREYVRILTALVRGQEPRLRSGKFRELNDVADQEFRNQTMLQLSKRLVNLQRQLEQLACALPDPQVMFSIKEDSTLRTLHDWSPRVTAHIASHILRLARAERRLHPTRQHAQ